MNGDQIVPGVGGNIHRSFRMQDLATQAMVTRERSFVRPQSHHHFNHHPQHQMRDGNKRKSMIVTSNTRGKPTMEIYRPPKSNVNGDEMKEIGSKKIVDNVPTKVEHVETIDDKEVFTSVKPIDECDSGTNRLIGVCKGVRIDGVQQHQNHHGQPFGKLNVHAKEFTMSRPNELANSRSSMNLNHMYHPNAGGIMHSKSSGNVLQQLGPPQGPQQMSRTHALLNAMYPPHQVLPLLSSASTSNMLHNPPRVHFKLPQQQSNTVSFAPMTHEKKKFAPMHNQQQLMNGGEKNKYIKNQGHQLLQPSPLKRSKSLTATDTLASGMAALGLTADATDLGKFPQEVQDNLDKATSDPNQLSARMLMELVGQVLHRAVESPRYALPAARTCITIIEKERTQTFLESLLNTCQQWYKDRDKIFNVMIGGGRPRFMAFISLLLELFCQLRRRCSVSGNNNQASISPPARAILTLICKCCEECIKAPVPSASDTENLFFVLTYIGRDLETQLPGDLERLLSAVRDAFMNTSAAAPSVSKTLLQLIELHASHWRLPGGAVLYYYPSAK